jgi:hypothetical protein
MNQIRYDRIRQLLFFSITFILTTSLFAGATDPPNLVPAMTLQYEDPQSGEQIVHEIDSYTKAQKTYQVPGGVELTLIFEVLNTGDNPPGDPVSVDVWLDWTGDEMPADESDADFVCVPEGLGDCVRFEKTIQANAGYEGNGGKSVYHILIWVDRFDTLTEVDDNDNVLGPIKVVAVPVLYMQKPSEVKARPPVLKTPTKIKRSTGH